MKIAGSKQIIIISSLFTIVVLYKIYFDKDKIEPRKKSCKNSYTPCIATNVEIELSRKLNEAQKKIGRLSCEISKNEVSAHGGWCSTISGKNSSFHKTDISLAKELSSFFKNKAVASFGDGPGEYKVLIDSMKEVQIYTAYDGAPFAEETTNHVVKYLDLSVPIYHLPLYDWIISMEVAEHIPKEFEQIFINNLARHAKEGIVLSWSIVGQEGHSHVNNQNLPYVLQELEKRDFKMNENLTKRIKDACTFPWLQRNLYVYLRQHKL